MRRTLVLVRLQLLLNVRCCCLWPARAVNPMEVLKIPVERELRFVQPAARPLDGEGELFHIVCPRSPAF